MWGRGGVIGPAGGREIPSDLNVRNTTLFQWPDLSVHNLNRFLDEIKFGHRFGLHPKEEHVFRSDKNFFRLDMRKSMYILKDPSFFLTNNIETPQGKDLGLINPFERTTYYAGDGQLFFSQHIRCLRVSSYLAPTYQSYLSPAYKQLSDNISSLLLL
ncbi:hypothetical protein Tco_0810111 [Tanacetum coccineum]